MSDFKSHNSPSGRMQVEEIRPTKPIPTSIFHEKGDIIQKNFQLNQETSTNLQSNPSKEKTMSNGDSFNKAPEPTPKYSRNGQTLAPLGNVTKTANIRSLLPQQRNYKDLPYTTRFMTTTPLFAGELKNDSHKLEGHLKNHTSHGHYKTSFTSSTVSPSAATTVENPLFTTSRFSNSNAKVNLNNADVTDPFNNNLENGEINGWEQTNKKNENGEEEDEMDLNNFIKNKTKKKTQNSQPEKNKNRNQIKVSKTSRYSFPVHSAGYQPHPNVLASPMGMRQFHFNLKTLPRDYDDSKISVAVSTLLQTNMVVDPRLIAMPNHEPVKCSFKSNGIIKGYAANTNQGIIRNYNEDRVAIILNILKPPKKKVEYWPRCAFFGLYDGHGGTACADFLRDRLHQYVIKDENFPLDVERAIRNGFAKAENEFLNICENKGKFKQANCERSGSCALVALIVDDICYLANVGDSRAILSTSNKSAKNAEEIYRTQSYNIFPLTKDHRPMDETEHKRIITNGGKIYQTQALTKVGLPGISNGSQAIVGPYRVFPGRLSVSRTFGDIEAKMPIYGGNPKVVVAVPDVKSFKVTKEHDFLVMGCDGIFDRLTNRDVVEAAWKALAESKETDIHKLCGESVELILRTSISKRTLDNVTIVFIGFENFLPWIPLTNPLDPVQPQLRESVIKNPEPMVPTPKYRKPIKSSSNQKNTKTENSPEKSEKKAKLFQRLGQGKGIKSELENKNKDENDKANNPAFYHTISHNLYKRPLSLISSYSTKPQTLSHNSSLSTLNKIANAKFNLSKTPPTLPNVSTPNHSLQQKIEPLTVIAASSLGSSKNGLFLYRDRKNSSKKVVPNKNNYSKRLKTGTPTLPSQTNQKEDSNFMNGKALSSFDSSYSAFKAKKKGLNIGIPNLKKKEFAVPLSKTNKTEFLGSRQASSSSENLKASNHKPLVLNKFSLDNQEN